MLVRSGLDEAAELLPGVDDVVEFDAAWVLFDPPPVSHHAIADLLGAVEAGQFDAALVLTSFHQSPLPLALLMRMAGVPWIGAICEDYPGSLLDLRHRVADGLPESERNLSLTRAAVEGTNMVADVEGEPGIPEFDGVAHVNALPSWHQHRSDAAACLGPR